MSSISNLASIHQKAIIGTSVIVEPFAYIDDNVVVGDNSIIMSGAQLRSGTRLGSNCVVFPGAVVGAIPQDLKFKGEDTLAIVGDYTTIRECVTINRGTSAKNQTIVGDHCLLMAYSHVAHDCILSDYVIIGNATQLAGEVEVDHHAILSGGTLVHQFTRIGAHAMIQGGTRLGKDIPPFTIAGREPVCYAGVNSIGLRRHGFDNAKINEIQEIYRVIYQSGYNVTDALVYIENNFDHNDEALQIIKFVRSSSRGIVRGFL